MDKNIKKEDLIALFSVECSYTGAEIIKTLKKAFEGELEKAIPINQWQRITKGRRVY